MRGLNKLRRLTNCDEGTIFADIVTLTAWQGIPFAYPEPDRRTDFEAVMLLALKLGTTAFGSPASRIAMLRRETVERRQWIDDQRFLDLLGFTDVALRIELDRDGVADRLTKRGTARPGCCRDRLLPPFRSGG